MAKQHIRKADILLIIVCLLFALVLGLYFLFAKKSGAFLRISYDGKELYTIRLEEYSSKNAQTQRQPIQYYLITYADDTSLPEINRTDSRPDCPIDMPYNLLCISAGEVWMEAADCRDQICVRHKPVSHSLESIICLPHRLSVEIIGASGEDNTLDGVVK